MGEPRAPLAEMHKLNQQLRDEHAMHNRSSKLEHRAELDHGLDQVRIFEVEHTALIQQHQALKEEFDKHKLDAEAELQYTVFELEAKHQQTVQQLQAVHQRLKEQHEQHAADTSVDYQNKMTDIVQSHQVQTLQRQQQGSQMDLQLKTLQGEHSALQEEFTRYKQKTAQTHHADIQQVLHEHQVLTICSLFAGYALTMCTLRPPLTHYLLSSAH